LSDLNIKSSVGVNPGVGANNNANPLGKADAKGGSAAGAANASSFAATLQGQISGLDQVASKVDASLAAKAATVKPTTLQFSNHAVERMSQRGIVFSPDQMTRIEDGARKAAEKGAKETLILADESALIVDLKKNMIVTVMDKNMMKENVFTKIDSTVVI
jgi:flagellar operon protein